MNDTRNKKDKNQHIQVFVRVRPINGTEKANKSPVVVDVPSNREIVVGERPQDKLTKKFTFDKVFGPVSKQIDVYNAVVSPLLEEVLAGYNCTVFAYGQTGTGKTFTMEGTCNDPSLHWQTDTTAGIIPRSLSHLFDELRTLGAQEYSVRVSFLELYNEELFDLLSPNDDASKIRIYEDASRKGSIIIHGLEEVTVHNKSEVYKILEKGSEKRQTAATLMNAQSSRSHTVFSITVHIKENTVDGEELLKTGKLNLVDLAGSENVGRSGAVDRRAREAGNINQSLLTLGRVITALVERAPHIPYRESKLTRLLQESLGGRTKTSIIATISPANMNIEETLSTLDYAHRAKNITNRPEINQKLSKKALLKEYTEEIERLRRDLLATRERNGVYLAQENFTEMQTLIEVQKKELEEKINHIKALEETMHNKEKLFGDLKMEYETVTTTLQQTEDKLITTNNQLNATVYDRDLHKHLVDKHVTTEKALLNQAKILLNVAETATTDTQKLHEKISRKKQIEEENENVTVDFKERMSKRFKHAEEDLDIFTQQFVNFCSSFKEQISSIATYHNQEIDTTIKHISKDLVEQEEAISTKLVANAMNTNDEYHSWINTQKEEASNLNKNQRQVLQNTLVNMSPKIRELVENTISENLRALHNETSLKLINLVNYTKQSIDDFCGTLLINRDNLTKQMDEMKTTVEIAVENQNKIVQNEQSFTKMFTNLKNQFEYTFKQYEDITSQNKQIHSVISKKHNEMQAKCEDVIQNNLINYDENVNQEIAIKERIETCTEAIRDEVSSTLEQNWNIADNAVIQGTNLINQLEGDINSSRSALLNYNNLFESAVMELQQITDKEKETIVSKVQDYHKIVSDASTNHARFMEEQRATSYNNYSEMNYKLESQTVAYAEWNKKINSHLHSMHQNVENFVSDELRKDIPTGTTPIRRDFNYPRNLTATSPHERIIKRFREVRKVVENSEEEDNSTIIQDSNTIIETMSPNVNGNRDDDSLTSPMSIKSNHVKCSTPKSESKLRNPMLYQNNINLTKSYSTSDLSQTTKAQLDTTVLSESEIIKRQHNKENGVAFLKPERTRPKRLSKPKYSNRKVLGSYN